MKNRKNSDSFGLYCRIRMKRFGAEDEIYLHKIINKIRSNSYTDVPVATGKGDVLHDEIEEVYSVICCGVDESEVYRVKCSDVEICDGQVKEKEGLHQNPYYHKMKFDKDSIKKYERLLSRCEIAALSSLEHLSKKEKERNLPVLNALIADYIQYLKDYAKHVDDEIERSYYYNPHEIGELIDLAESRQVRYRDAGVDKHDDELEDAIDLLIDAQSDAYGT